ncbi:MaoC/PaaZ C-terminal domain-containing protein [Marinobacter subterrani]|uniref:MaoC/PaaZ C-terminal domain-containing protein n=1 Tax=Marinobacter subterrani TaxID=1658765 RepID=UPI0023549AB3|nr:MaoC/PaaZ C-terminal domain-containing protein [Marinobacter subterrani]
MGTTRFQSPWLRYLDQRELEQYARVSCDHNPIHLEPEQALSAGYPDVICHGMLAMTDIGDWLTQVMAGWRMTDFSCRFPAPVPVRSRLRVSAIACVGDSPESNGQQARVSFIAEDQNGAMKVKGQATFRKPEAR